MAASQPLYRPANRLSFEQGQKSLVVAQAQLNAAEQDLIIRTTQAYFDVLAAQDTLTFVKAQKPPSRSNWPPPSATLKWARPQSPIHGRRKPGSIWWLPRKSPPRTTCESKAGP